MSIIDKVKAHNETVELASVYISEWDETLYYKPITVAELDKVGSVLRSKPIEGMIDILIMKGLNKDGSRAFSVADKPHFLNYTDVTPITKAADAIMNHTTVKDAEKN